MGVISIMLVLSLVFTCGTTVVEYGDSLEEPVLVEVEQETHLGVQEPVQELKEVTKNIYSSISMTDVEKEELAKVLALEAQNQSFEGQCAVIEAVFNRVLNDWGEDVHSVLSAEGQFCSWKYVENPKVYVPYNEPTEMQYEVINFVLENGNTVLSKYCKDTGYDNPEEYVYFATYKINGDCFIKIQDHYFSKEV